VKRYSSGMYVRLAFAVAAHLEPEILLVDEVLSVGDASFQKKCLGKMGEVGHQGRTILFVSHNMSAVQSLCTRSIWIDHGAVKMDGPSSSIVSSYLNQGQLTSGQRVWTENECPGNNSFRLVSIPPTR
jgi:lipopolysaccharide transport system ATP-binding protein